MQPQYSQHPATCPCPEPDETNPHNPKATTVSFLVNSKSPLINNPTVLGYLNRALNCKTVHRYNNDVSNQQDATNSVYLSFY
jgi:hypothetical protein